MSCCEFCPYRTVADEESLVAGGHEVAGLPVGSVTDLIALVSHARAQFLPASPIALGSVCPTVPGVVRVVVPWAWQPGP
jgi:hypothetical protein